MVYPKKLIVTVGIPRSGKSTWSRESGFPIVNPDSIRLALHGKTFLPERENEVWHIARMMVSSLFLAGHRVVVLDATNITRLRRNEWVSPNWQTNYKVFTTDKSTCIERAIDGNREDLVPVIERMASQFDPLGADELLWEF
jgi:predicted kinase